MKKYLSALVLAVAVMLSISTANSQPYPSPTFQNLTILGTCTGCGGGGGGITSLTGPVTGSGTGAVATTITPTGVTAGSYTSANVTVNAAGQITFAANGSGGSGVAGPGSSVNNDVAAWNGTGGNTLLDTNILYTNLATLAGTQTLTNKTLTGPTITSPSITGTISGSAAATFGAITGTTLNTTGGVTHSGLATSGTIGGSVCATSAGVLLYESGVNCESGGGSGTVTSIATTAPLSGGTITTSGTLSLTGPSNLTTFTAGTVPMGATTSPFVASEISDVGSGGVTIGSPTGGQKGAGSINVAACFINNVPCAAGGSGSVGSGTTNQIAGYASSGTAVGGVTVSGDFTLLGSTGVGTLATVNSNVGSFTNANITVNAKGLITAAANGSGGSGSPGGSSGQTQYNNSGAFGGYTPSGACTVVASTGVFTCFGSATATLPATDLSGTLAAAQFPALTGDLTTTAGSLATTLATVNSNVGSFTNASITVNAKGLITAASNGTGGSATTNRITTGTTNTLSSITNSFTTELWASATTGAKSDSVPACASGINNDFLIEEDAQGTAGTYPITVTPASGTINGGTAYTIPSNTAATVFQCDGTGTAWRLVAVNYQGSAVRSASATSLTLGANDNGNVIAQSNASAVAATIAQAGTSGFPEGGYSTTIINTGAGAITITPATSTINGGTTLVIPGGSPSAPTGATVFADLGANYVGLLYGTGSGGISGLTTNTIPKATSSTTIGNSSVTDNGTIINASAEPVSLSQYYSTPSSLTMSASTVATNAALATVFTGTMVHADSPYTFSNPTNLVAGQNVTYVLSESSTGGDTVGTWGSDFTFPGGTPVFNPTANNQNVVSCQVTSSSALTCFGPGNLHTTTVCASAASPAACGSAQAGLVAIPTGTNPTLVIDDTSVTSSTSPWFTVDQSTSAGTTLGITCNSSWSDGALTSLPAIIITSITPGTSFTIQLLGTISTNDACVRYGGVN